MLSARVFGSSEGNILNPGPTPANGNDLRTSGSDREETGLEESDLTGDGTVTVGAETQAKQAPYNVRLSQSHTKRDSLKKLVNEREVWRKALELTSGSTSVYGASHCSPRTWSSLAGYKDSSEGEQSPPSVHWEGERNPYTKILVGGVVDFTRAARSFSSSISSTPSMPPIELLLRKRGPNLPLAGVDSLHNGPHSQCHTANVANCPSRTYLRTFHRPSTANNGLAIARNRKWGGYTYGPEVSLQVRSSRIRYNRHIVFGGYPYSRHRRAWLCSGLNLSPRSMWKNVKSSNPTIPTRTRDHGERRFFPSGWWTDSREGTTNRRDK